MANAYKTLCVVIVLLAVESMLIALGVWQLSRHQWKQALIANVTMQQTLAPVVYDGKQQPYQRVRITGNPVGTTFHVYSGKRPNTLEDGHRLLVPWQSEIGPVLLVDIGWVPTSQAEKLPVTMGAEVTGTLIPGDRPGWLVPKHTQLPRDLWYWVDITTMAQALKLSLTPYYLVMETGHPGCIATPVIPHWHQRHLEYAFTWFALALTLAVMVGVKAVKRKA